MSDVGAIVNQAVAQDRAALQVQVGVSVLKQAIEIQEETVLKLLETLGVGQNIDIQA